MQYSLNDIVLIPAPVTKIKSRKDVCARTVQGGTFPIFVAPMTCIINDSNWIKFSFHGFIPIMPVRYSEYRNLYIDGRWQAVTLKEFKSFFIDDHAERGHWYHILIDVANGHMEELYEMVKTAKIHYGSKLEVMVGNIANPETYFECCRAHVDYVRVGIGGGSGCTTSVQTGIHASLPWLLESILALKDFKKQEQRKDSWEDVCDALSWTPTKIIADGGVNTIDKAIKCLALGADYVMIGKMFAQCEEACAKEKATGTLPSTEKHYYGQSSKQGQIDRFGEVKNNPEGTDLWVPVIYTLESFASKFEAALRSAMSYCNASNLDEFIGKVKWDVQPPTEYMSYQK